MFDLLKDTQNSPCPLVQCCEKSGEAAAGSGGQELARKLATNIVRVSQFFVIDCRIPFLGKICPTNQNCQFILKFGT